MTTFVFEYIWLDSVNECRSKTKVTKLDVETPQLENLPLWNYDGSSTDQATTEKSEIVLRPVKMVRDPFRRNDYSYLVLCDILNNDHTPHEYNTRQKAVDIFNQALEQSPMFGLEQEFFLSRLDNESHVRTLKPIGLDSRYKFSNQGEYYCSVGYCNAIGRNMMEEALDNLVYSDINITGMNAEVAPSQWEFQVCSTGIDAADSLFLMRYICNRTFEGYNCVMDLSVKPNSEMNGSGCHVNFSTQKMREANGFEEIMNAVNNLEKAHDLHIKHYGLGNELRLTGIHETSSIDKFSYGVGSRDTSIRIPNDTKNNNCGYFEDRRPSSLLDPYVVTSLLFATSCNISQTHFN